VTIGQVTTGTANAPVSTGPLTARVAVLGATGYAGGEFARLALAHPGITLDALVARALAGQELEAMLPGIDPRALAGGGPARVDFDGLLERIEGGTVDTLVIALPHGAWTALLAERPALARAAEGLRLLDLWSDHRDGSAGYVYGLPEAYRDTLLMRLVEGMSGAEIAERSGLTPASVRVNLHRGMKLLREHLGAS